MMLTSRLGVVAFCLALAALVAIIAALGKSRDNWRHPTVLILVAMMLPLVHLLVPLSEGIQVGFAILSLLISVTALYRLVRIGRPGTAS